MTNKYIQSLLIIVLACFSSICCQTDVQTITFKEGEVLDILLISQHEAVQDDLKSYFELAFPVAKRMSYQPLPGFKITGLIKGNHQPSSLILGKWAGLEEREKFLVEIEKELIDFHERRRTIWSYFGLEYFVLPTDHTITIDRSKFHVATAFWCTDVELGSDYYATWIAEMESSGGDQLVELSNGTSPDGYYYGATHFVISSWENAEAFATFQQKMEGVERDNLYHINELTIE